MGWRGVEGGCEEEDMVGILWKVMGRRKEEKFGRFGKERVLEVKDELGNLVVNNRNEEEIVEDVDMVWFLELLGSGN